MNRKNLIIAITMLALGVIFGVAGYALATSAPSPGTMFSKMWGGEPTGPADTATLTNSTGSSSALSDEGLSDDSNGESSEPSQEPAEESLQDGDELDEELVAEIISDYKLNVGTFFTAWKAKDMAAFRAKLSEAYSGEILERHAQQAEQFITQGVGLNVVDINFDSIDVISAEPMAATLTAAYTYLAQDYLVGEELPVGEVYGHEVKVKVNMVKVGTRWLITAEAPFNAEEK